jgi:hypothetical protein
MQRLIYDHRNSSGSTSEATLRNAVRSHRPVPENHACAFYSRHFVLITTLRETAASDNGQLPQRQLSRASANLPLAAWSWTLPATEL